MKKICTIVTVSISLGVLSVHASDFYSNYTSIEEKDCTTIATHEVGSVQSCQGIGDIQVQVIEGDLRQSITLIRKGTEYPLNFWETVSPYFSELGPKVEWRYKKSGKSGALIALITRLNVSEKPNKLNKKTSYLVVSKITADQICVVGKVPPQKEQNQKARTMAEQSVDMSCLNAGISAEEAVWTQEPTNPTVCTQMKTSLASLIPSSLTGKVAAYNEGWSWLTQGADTCLIKATKGFVAEQGYEIADAITTKLQNVGFKYTDGADGHEGTVQVWKTADVHCLLWISYMGDIKDVDSLVVACQ